MRNILALTEAIALIGGGATAVSAQSIDKAGKCHAANGAFAKMEVCKAVKPAAAGKCRDKTSKKFAKCGAPNTEPVPTK
jgi:hypothetical protein